MFIKSLFSISTLLLLMTTLNATELNQNNMTQDKRSNEIITKTATNEATKAISARKAIATWQQKLSDEGYYIGEINGLSSPELNRATKGYLRDRI